jgi:methionyl-tRNA formyltransferase
VSFALAGTPRFASWVLRDLVEFGRLPVLVISQPDRPCGRGRRRSAPETVCRARELGIECIQTEDINSPEVYEALGARAASTLVVAAFGQLLREPLLGSYTCLNIHGSLLPKYRGPAPVERALAAGEAVTGVTIMRVTERLDEGPWAQQVEVSVSMSDDAGSLGRSLALVGAIAVGQVLDAMAAGVVEWREQSGVPSYAPKLGVRDLILDTSAGARQVHDQVRSLCPHVGVRTSVGGLEMKIWRTWPYGQPDVAVLPHAVSDVAGVPGKVGALAGRLFVGCGEGAVEILELQPVNRKRMPASAFLRGYGDRLGVDMGFHGQVGPVGQAREG